MFESEQEELPNVHPDFWTLMELWEEREIFLDDFEQEGRDVECEVYDRVTERMLAEEERY